MRKRRQFLLLIALCGVLSFTGCRRRPIETETQTETETETETQTEAQTEKPTETETESETQRQTTKKTTVTPNTTQPQTQATEAPVASTQQCPYCGEWFGTTAGVDGTSVYSSHIAQEEAYISSQNSYDGSDYQTGSDGNLYAQCPYCFQWFSDMPDAGGYSPYADHVAAESAYAAQQANESYVQCPYCGNWVTPDEYQDHVNNGW